jgi:hypothetical protein
MGGRRSGNLAAVIVLGLVFLLPASSSASELTGGITRISIAPDQATAGATGYATWSGCVPPIPDREPPQPEEGEEDLDEPGPVDPVWLDRSCGWHPFALVAVGESAADCPGGAGWDPSAPPPGIDLIWDGVPSSQPETQTFDVEDFPLTGGARLLCLEATEEGPTRCMFNPVDAVCEPTLPVLRLLAAAVLPAPESPVVSPPPAVLPVPKTTGRHCRRTSRLARSRAKGRCARAHHPRKRFSRNEPVSVS